MIMLRRASQRHHDRRRNRQEGWLTFSSEDRGDSLAEDLGTLEVLSEDRLPPGAGVPRHSRHDAEIVTYVREGALAYEDDMGRSGVIQAGEFHHMTAGPGLRHSETNLSRSDWAHVFQIWLRSSAAGLEASRGQKRFSAAERRGVLCVVASLNGRRGSLPIDQDVSIYSAMLDRGHHVIHELSAGRLAWVHLVHGEVVFGDVVLTTGDGAGVTAERAVSLTAQETSELLLIDLRARQHARSHESGDVP